MIKNRWFHINNFHMRQERWCSIPNHTKFEVFELLYRTQIFLKWNLWVMLFYKTEYGHGKMTWKMAFFDSTSEYWSSKVFWIWMIDHNIILLLSCQIGFQMRIFAKLLNQCMSRRRSQLYVGDSYQPTDSTLEGQGNVNATVIHC